MESRATKLIIYILFSFLYTGNAFSQISVDSIRYNETDQSVLILYLNEDISYTPTFPMNSSDWKVYHGGTQYPAVSLVSRGLFDPDYSIRLKIASAISYSESQEGITVEYLGTGPVISGSSGNLGAIPPWPAANNLPLDCDAFKLNRGLETMVDKTCSPVTVTTEITYYLKSEYLNSVYYDPANVYIRIVWGDGNIEYQTPLTSNPGSTTLKGIFVHAYPDDPTFCSWTLLSMPGITGHGVCGGGGLQQEQSILNHSVDNEGSGYFTMDRDTIRICIGQSFSESFSDATLFNCRKDIEPSFPNIGERWVRFSYGTTNAGGDRISDVMIDGNTVSFPYVGELIRYDSADTPFPNASTLPISHISDLGADNVGQIFEVKLENWGPCNNIYEGKLPITTYSYIKITDGPIANAGSDFSICEGSKATMNGSIERTAVLGVWSTKTGDGNFEDFTSPSGARYTPGSNDISNGGVWLTLTASDAGASCPNHSDSVYLTIDPLPDAPSLSASSPLEFCYDAGATQVQLTAEESPAGIYEWYKNGNLQPSFTTRTINLEEVSQSGAWSVKVFGNTTNNCPSPASVEKTITIHPLATTTDPDNQEVCDDDNMTSGDVSFSVTTGGPAHSVQWQRSNNNGSSWVNITGENTPNDGCDYSGYTSNTLDIESADYPMNQYLFRVVVTTTTGNCPVYSAPATLTVHPLAGINTPPSAQTVCEGESTGFSVDADITSGSITDYQWQRNNSTINAGTDGGVYDDFDTENLIINGTPYSLNTKEYRVVITSDKGCPVRTGKAKLTVNPLADITSQPGNKIVCEGSNTSFTIVTDGSPAVTAYQWKVSSDGGSIWSNASEGIYQNGTTATLNLNNIPLSHNSYQYKCILSSNGDCDIESDIAILTVNPSPAVNIDPSNPSELCNGEMISFNGNPTGGTPSYTHQWTGDTQPLSNTNSPDPVFTAPVTTSLSTYSLSYTVKDDNNCTASGNVSIQVKPAVTVNITASDNEVCAGQTVNLNGNPGGGTPGFSHDWTGTNPAALSADDIYNPVFTAPNVSVQTVFTYQYTATDSKGCSNTGSVDIVVNPLPTTSISPATPGMLCYNESLTLDGNAGSGTAPYSHSWNGDTDPLNNINTETPEFTAPSVSNLQDYQLNYTVEDSKGCTASDTITVSVLAHLEEAVLSGDASICSGFSTNLSVSVTGGLEPYTLVLNNGTSNITVNNYQNEEDIPTGALSTTTSYSLVSVTDANGCFASSVSGSATIIVGSVPLSAELKGGNEICLGSEAFLSVEIEGGAPPYTIETDNLGTIYNYYPGDNLSAGILGLGVHQFNLLSVKDTCGNTISGNDVNTGNPQTISVNSLPDISLTTNNQPLLCNGGTTDIELLSSIPGTKFKWIPSDGGGINWVAGKAPHTDSLTDGAGIEKISQTLQHNMTSPVSVEYVIQPTGPGFSACPGNSVTHTVIIEPTLGITASDLVICNQTTTEIEVQATGNGLHGEKYSWTVSAHPDLSGYSAGPPEGTSFANPVSQVLSNNGDTARIAKYIITPYTLDEAGNISCPGLPDTVNIRVEPDIILNAENDTICSNTNTNIEVTTLASCFADKKYTWTVVSPDSVTGAVNGPASGVDFTQNISQNLINSSKNPQIVTYSLTGFCTDGSGNPSCYGSPLEVSIVVEPTVDILAEDLEICYNTGFSLTPTSTSTGIYGTKYNWIVNASGNITGENNGPTGGQDFGTSISQTLKNEGFTADTARYSITAYTTDASGNLHCQGNTRNVAVLAEPKIILTASDKTICSNSSTSLDVNTLYSGAEGTLYTWTVSSPAGITGAADDSLGGLDPDINLSQTLINHTDSALIVSYHLTGYTTDAAGNFECPGPSLDVDITVEPTVSVQAMDTTICSGSSPFLRIETLSGASYAEKYTWTVEAPDEITGESNGPAGGVDFSQALDQELTNTGYTPQTVVYTITGYATDAAGNLLCPGTPVTAEVIVEPAITLTASDTIICNNTSVNLDVNTLYTASNSLVYTWTVSAPDSLQNAQNGPPEGVDFSQNINQVLVNTGTTPKIATYTLTPYTTDAAGNLKCAGQSREVKITVEPDILVTASDQDVCFGDTAIISVSSVYSSTYGIKYSWTVDAPASVTGAEDGVPGGQELNIPVSQKLENTGNITEEVVYTLTAYTTNASGSILCAGTPAEVSVLARPLPKAVADNIYPVIPTENYTSIILTGEVPGTNFGWRVLNPGSTGAVNGNGLLSGDTIRQQLFNTGTTPVTIVYRIGPSANLCTGDSIDVSVQINPVPELTITNMNPEICSGDSTLIYLETPVSGSHFSWTVSDPDSTQASGDTLIFPSTGAYIRQQLINTDSIPAIVEYTVTPTGPPPSNIPGTPKNTTVTVYPRPMVNTENVSPRICNGTSTQIVLNSNVQGTSFTWTVIDPTMGASGASASLQPVGIGDTISQVLVNTGNTPYTITYRIVPLGPDPLNCEGDMKTVEVVVDPTPVAYITNTKPVICSEDQTLITLDASVSGTWFEYSVEDPKGTGAIDSTGNIQDAISQQLFNSTQNPVNILYNIIPIGPGSSACQGTPVYKDVIINPLPVTTEITGVDTICESTPGLVFQVDLTANSYYEWNVPQNLGDVIIGGSGLNNNAVVLNAGTGNLTDSLSVQETNRYNCTKETIYKPLTIVKQPGISIISGPVEVCASSENVNYSVPANPGSTYQWFVPTGSGVVSDPTLNQVNVNMGSLSGQVRVIETSAGECVTIHTPLNVTINPMPITTLNADKLAICAGETVTFTAGPIVQDYQYEFFVNGISVQNGPSHIFETNALNDNDEVNVKVTSDKGCDRVSSPLIISVEQNPIVNLSSSVPGNSFCKNTEVSFEASSPTAVNYTFYRNNSVVQNRAINFYTSTNLVDGDEIYVEVTSALGCTGESNKINTTVFPLPEAYLSGDNSICPGESTPVIINITNGAAPFEATLDQGIGAIEFNGLSENVSVSPLTTTSYSLTSVKDGNGCVSDYYSGNISGNITIELRDTVEIIQQPFDASVCQGEDTSFTVHAAGDGLVYQWEYSTDPSTGFIPVTPSMTGHTGINNASLHIQEANPAFDEYFYRVKVSSVWCPETDYSDTVRLYIRYNPVTLNNPTSQQVCNGDETGFGIDAGLTENPSFQWQVSTDNGDSYSNLSDTSVYRGSKTDSLSLTTTYSRFSQNLYRVIVEGYCGEPVISAPASLTILERPRIANTLEDISLCENSSASFSIDAGETTNPVYKWYYLEDNEWTEVLSDSIHSDVNTSTLSLKNVPSSIDGREYLVELSGICSPSVNSNSATLNVYDRAEISTQPEDVFSCRNTNISFTVGTGDTDNPNMKWQVDEGDGWKYITEEDNYSGYNSHQLRAISIDSSMTGNRYRVLVFGICPDSVISAPASLTVLNEPIIRVQPADIAVCEGENAAFNTEITGDSLSYQWYADKNNQAGFQAIEDIPGIYSGTHTNELILISPDRSMHNYRYRVSAAGYCSPGTVSSTATLKINTKPNILSEPTDIFVCENGNAYVQVIAEGAGLSYSWEENRGEGWNSLSDTLNYSGTQTPELSLFNINPGMDQYKYRVHISGTCPDDTLSREVSLSVGIQPSIIKEPGDTLVCQDLPVYFTVEATGSELTYQWQISTGGTFTNLSDNGIYSGTHLSTLSIPVVTPDMNNNYYRVVVSGACSPPVNSAEASLKVENYPVIISQPAPAIICEGNNTSFTCQTNSQNTDYQWEIKVDENWISLTNDSIYQGTESPTLTLINVPENFNGNLYRVILKSICYPVSSDEVSLLVNANPEPEITGDKEYPYNCAGTLLNLNGNPRGGSGNYVSHSWTGDTSPLSSTSHQTTSFNSLIRRDYYINYTVVDDKGCKGSTSTVITNDKPLAEFVSDAIPACGNLEVHFTNSTTGAESYEWDFDDDSPVDTSYNVNHYFDNQNPSGVVDYYNVKLVATSPSGCRDTARQTITIYPKVNPDFEMSPDSGCQPVMASFTTQSGALEYEWDFGDGQQETGTHSMNHLYTNTSTEVKTFTVSLTTTSFYNCVASTSKQIKVFPIPDPSFTASPAIQRYPDATVSVINTVREGPWIYQYNFGDGNISVEENPVHTYNNYGSYNIVQTIRSGMCVDSTSHTVIIDAPLPIAEFNTPESGCTPHSIQFENLSQHAVDYYWDFGDGGISTDANPEYIFTRPGTFTISLTAMGPGGSANYVKSLEIWPMPDLSFESYPDSVRVNDKAVKFLNYSSLAPSYLWDFGDYQEETGRVSSTNQSTDREPSHIYEFTGWKDVMLIAWNEHCRDTLIRENEVYVADAGELIFPNVFKPNPYGPTGGEYHNLPASEINTVFHPAVINEVTEYKLSIYNRWGELVYTSDDVTIGWDGYINGTLANQGVYVWKVEGKYAYGKFFTDKGDVTLLH